MRKFRAIIVALAAMELISAEAIAQVQTAVTPAPNTRSLRRMLNAQNCHIEFAMVRDVPLRVYVPNAPFDSTRPAGAGTSIFPSNDTSAVNCYVSTYFSRLQAAETYYFHPPPVAMTVRAPADTTPIPFVPRKIIMSSAGGDVGLPFKPTPDSGVIRKTKRPPR